MTSPNASEAEAIMERTVHRHRPQSDPAPHIAATSLEFDAPAATASVTVWAVAPTHRHTYINASPLLVT